MHHLLRQNLTKIGAGGEEIREERELESMRQKLAAKRQKERILSYFIFVKQASMSVIWNHSYPEKGESLQS